LWAELIEFAAAEAQDDLQTQQMVDKRVYAFKAGDEISATQRAKRSVLLPPGEQRRWLV
jgi:hypothetical protein